MAIRTSNLDKTRTRIVRKGHTCDFFGLRFRVVATFRSDVRLTTLHAKASSDG